MTFPGEGMAELEGCVHFLCTGPLELHSFLMKGKFVIFCNFLGNFCTLRLHCGSAVADPHNYNDFRVSEWVNRGFLWGSVVQRCLNHRGVTSSSWTAVTSVFVFIQNISGTDCLNQVMLLDQVCAAGGLHSKTVYMCSSSLWFSEHTSGNVHFYGERNRSGPGHRRQRSLFLPAAFALLRYRWTPRHRHRHQASGLRDDVCVPAHRQRHGQQARTVLFRDFAQIQHVFQLGCFHQDQDKLRPLSRLANLAITITDVQDMDPIFTNLPYSTNIEEDVPLVSTDTTFSFSLNFSLLQTASVPVEELSF